MPNPHDPYRIAPRIPIFMYSHDGAFRDIRFQDGRGFTVEILDRDASTNNVDGVRVITIGIQGHAPIVLPCRAVTILLEGEARYYESDNIAVSGLITTVEGLRYKVWLDENVIGFTPVRGLTGEAEEQKYYYDPTQPVRVEIPRRTWEALQDVLQWWVDTNPEETLE